MDKSIVILFIIISIAYCELVWWEVRTGKETPQHAIGRSMKIIMYLNGFFAIMGAQTSFIFFYFISLYYFVIFRERGHELQTNKGKELDGPVA